MGGDDSGVIGITQRELLMEMRDDIRALRSAAETYEHVGFVALWVHDLERRWQDEEARTRVTVEDRTAPFRVEMRTAAPPQVLWEFVTAPGRRVAWTPGLTAVEVIAAGNRRGVGATSHCMHGKNASIEELLDWRPYDYYTLRNTVPTPIGPVSFLLTNELEPTTDGTILHMRAAAPKTRLAALP